MRPSGPDAPGALSRRRAEPLEALVIDGLPEHAVPVFEAALEQVCTTVAYFRDEPTDTWRCRPRRWKPMAGSPAPSRPSRRCRSAGAS